MTEQSLYSWQSSDFEIQMNSDFAKRASFIWVFNWHEIPHLGLSINGLYFSISISGIQQNVDIAKIWRLCEIKSITLFLIELVDYELDPVNAVNVEKRRNMWFFINELKNDKFMKKFVLWQ